MKKTSKGTRRETEIPGVIKIDRLFDKVQLIPIGNKIVM